MLHIAMPDDIDKQIRIQMEARERIKAQLAQSTDALDIEDSKLKEMQTRQQHRIRSDKRMTDTDVADKLREAQDESATDQV